MNILGIDTSCDETAASIVKDGKVILSNIVSSQVDIHKKYGGIVPELASRSHIESIIPVIDEALMVSGVMLKDISAIAVTNGPGLIGSLLVGVSVAKALSYAAGIPLVAINHLEGHIASLLPEYDIEFPFVALVVSGGHTNLYYTSDIGDYRELGVTRDDAAGEAYDKVAKMLGLGYPGGPILDRLAQEGNPDAISFPRATVLDGMDFSFSGLKTAVMNYLKTVNSEQWTVNKSLIKDIAASFQEAVVDVLISRLIEASRLTQVERIAITGGVAANTTLRKKAEEYAASEGLMLYIPSPHLCTDNAAMIAVAGYHYFKKNLYSDLTLNAIAYLPLGSVS
ncbi:MAG: tRNA (adenosine(37)-N6)-threonylcarbamoyltransferase complex transferase subunit TsaD [Nitrospirota bacterium]